MTMPAARAATLAAALLAGAPAVAGPLAITPTTVEMVAGRRSAAIEIVNQSDSPTDLQFRAFNWSQGGGDDRLEPTADLVVSPPIATLAPHGKQVFRILLADPSPAEAERSFRLKLNELPRGTSSAIAINVEFLLPVFATPKDAVPTLTVGAPPAPNSPAASPAADHGTITLANHGNRRLHLLALALQTREGTRVPIPIGHAAYILTGAERAFALPAGARIAPGARLSGDSDTGPIDVPLAAPTAR